MLYILFMVGRDLKNFYGDDGVDLIETMAENNHHSVTKPFKEVFPRKEE